MDRTFLMVKPRAVRDGLTGDILAELERGGFRIVGIASRKLTVEEAHVFYDVHVGKPFFETLVEFITSGMTVGVMLESPDAVTALRAFIGATDPAKATPDSIRGKYGKSMTENAVHASDAPLRVEHESAFHFGDCPRTLAG
ncbi:nucleoside-diphosphate kinase [bacterium]|nr:nucleoside-diphosphate kinase [bacterium]